MIEGLNCGGTQQIVTRISDLSPYVRDNRYSFIAPTMFGIWDSGKTILQDHVLEA